MIGTINAQREKEDALKKILHLEKQLDAKQALELEIEQLKGKLQVLKHMEGDDDTVQKRVLEMIKELEEKEGEMGDLEALNQTLIVKERKSNDELQDARKELIVVFFSLIFYLNIFFSYDNLCAIHIYFELHLPSQVNELRIYCITCILMG